MTDDEPTTDTTDESPPQGPVLDLIARDYTITLVNAETGDHRTLRTRTVRNGGMEGKKIIELLRGGDSDYIAFGFVVPAMSGHRVVVWKSYRGKMDLATGEYEKSKFDILANMIEDPAYWGGRGVEYRFAQRCLRCGRELTNPDSLDSGYGPECIKYV